ncbi:unnamed protein product [marine sediment metagenome]|uniref:Uncharacterized protein n=1 Tax=marine sediment metagenome TaxID=412755 RepID=X1G4P3_9ZZZZ
MNGQKQTCKEVQKQLKTRLEKARKESHSADMMDLKKIKKLKITKKINPYFWYWPEGGCKAI